MQADNIIIIKGGTYLQVKKALEQWIDLYIEYLNDKIMFELFKIDSNEFRIKVDEKLDNERFFFLINYLKYPEDIKYSIDVVGYTIGKDKNLLEGNKLLVYIPKDDDEYDNVYAVMVDNSTYKIGFNGSINQVEDERSYSPPKIIDLFNAEVIKVNLNEKKKTDKITQENGIDKRYRIISIIALGVFFLGVFSLYYYQDLMEKFIFFYGYGLCIWFFTDYKMIRLSKYYNISFMISILFLFIVLLINNTVNISKTNILFNGAIAPISLLTTQKIARWVFIHIIKREPIVDKPAPSVADFIYMMILFLFGIIFIPMVLLGIIK